LHGMDDDAAHEIKKVKRKVRIFLSVIGLFILSLIGYGIHWAFFDMERLPKGTVLAEQVSPDGTYTVRAYLSDMGATTSDSVVGELIFNKEHNKAKHIYFQYKQHTAEIHWVDHDTVVINGVELDVPDEVYDWRTNGITADEKVGCKEASVYAPDSIRQS
jgi:Family of unknown function (DUF5412)